MKNKYGLLFKTGESEIRALKNFPNKKGVFPIIELTRGRKTKRDTIGDIQKRIDQLAECFGNMDVILDLTTEPALSSTQIDTLYMPDNGYENWMNFLENIERREIFKDIYPSILLNVDDDDFEENLKKQVSSILRNYNGVSYRCNIEDEGYGDDIDTISDLIPTNKKFFFIVDCSYIRESELATCREQAIKIIRDIYAKVPHTSFILTSTSFPDKIGEENSATLPLTEIRLYNEVSRAVPAINIAYSDYGSINPIRNDNVIMANGWRPRIDVPLETEIFYYRRKKVPKGYAVTYSLVAVDATNDRKFPSDVRNWGTNQIINAADGSSPGSSPSFWISVRMNIYIEQQLRRLSLK
jgi:hypothetical protein